MTRGAKPMAHDVLDRYSRFKDWGQLFPSAAAASETPTAWSILVRIAGESKRSDQEVE